MDDTRFYVCQMVRKEWENKRIKVYALAFNFINIVTVNSVAEHLLRNHSVIGCGCIVRSEHSTVGFNKEKRYMVVFSSVHIKLLQTALKRYLMTGKWVVVYRAASLKYISFSRISKSF